MVHGDALNDNILNFIDIDKICRDINKDIDEKALDYLKNKTT